MTEETQEKEAKKDIINMYTVSLGAFLVIGTLAVCVIFPQWIPGGVAGGMIFAFIIVFIAIAWATLKGAKD